MKTHEKFLAAVIVVAIFAGLTAPHWVPSPSAAPRPRAAPAPTVDDAPSAPIRRERLPPFDPAAFASHVDTDHYAIASNATALQTQEVAHSLEALHAAYADFFAGKLPARTPGARFQIALYRDRDDFHRINHTRSWAHGYYRTPVCHAYYDARAGSPAQWILHEATHQLDTEWAGFARTPWIEEALASYFGTSRIVDGTMRPGDLDTRSYPLRWLAGLNLTGDRERDLAAHRIVLLRELIESDGPQARHDVNRYYLGYWSLAHYLMHAEDGRHAAAFRAMVADGATLEQFERQVGPVERVEAGWYAYLLAQRALLQAAPPPVAGD
jgi:hypothetical protein